MEAETIWVKGDGMKKEFVTVMMECLLRNAIPPGVLGAVAMIRDDAVQEMAVAEMRTLLQELRDDVGLRNFVVDRARPHQTFVLLDLYTKGMRVISESDEGSELYERMTGALEEIPQVLTVMTIGLRLVERARELDRHGGSA